MKKLFLSLVMLLAILPAAAQFGGYDPVSMENVVTVKGDKSHIATLCVVFKILFK